VAEDKSGVPLRDGEGEDSQKVEIADAAVIGQRAAGPAEAQALGQGTSRNWTVGPLLSPEPIHHHNHYRPFPVCLRFLLSPPNNIIAVAPFGRSFHLISHSFPSGLYPHKEAASLFGLPSTPSLFHGWASCVFCFFLHEVSKAFHTPRSCLPKHSLALDMNIRVWHTALYLCSPTLTPILAVLSWILSTGLIPLFHCQRHRQPSTPTIPACMISLI
jgi:hypothetical protein